MTRREDQPSGAIAQALKLDVVIPEKSIEEIMAGKMSELKEANESYGRRLFDTLGEGKSEVLVFRQYISHRDKETHLTEQFLVITHDGVLTLDVYDDPSSHGSRGKVTADAISHGIHDISLSERKLFGYNNNAQSIRIPGHFGSDFGAKIDKFGAAEANWSCILNLNPDEETVNRIYKLNKDTALRTHQVAQSLGGSQVAVR